MDLPIEEGREFRNAGALGESSWMCLGFRALARQVAH